MGGGVIIPADYIHICLDKYTYIYALTVTILIRIRMLLALSIWFWRHEVIIFSMVTAILIHYPALKLQLLILIKTITIHKLVSKCKSLFFLIYSSFKLLETIKSIKNPYFVIIEFSFYFYYFDYLCLENSKILQQIFLIQNCGQIHENKL